MNGQPFDQIQVRTEQYSIKLVRGSIDFVQQDTVNGGQVEVSP